MSKEQTLMIVGLSLGLFFVLLVFCFVVFFKINYLRKWNQQEKLGKQAEIKINEILNNWAKRHNFFFIFSNLFKYGDRQLFEVDGVLLTDKAVIIVEIKSINGIIKGNASDKKLLKILGKRKYPITNPVYQNDKHIYHIDKMLNGRFPILSLIIFSNRVEKLEIENNLNHVVIITESQIEQELHNLNSQLDVKLDSQMLLNIKNSFEKHITQEKKDYLTLKAFSNEK
ncbi:nuclease-related domain-containing protein [Mesomycoplasma lagogenitalium]|uniref:Nuclease-related domain-containing protein n=1 Tax=Mesomycoplasma lagogenitalium TaxID=171286 RepID=A0ABY8LX75_9BACT|nr:nuclease-related domain-containing protein [Mesomycoplasma lagogenitalium]WGI36866.1 nuclease-related domain-containing protein [Mesomycoplasma lagogenitalium]